VTQKTINALVEELEHAAMGYAQDPSVHTERRLNEARAALVAKFSRVAADSERYRWVIDREQLAVIGVAWGHSRAACAFMSADEAIDAAMANRHDERKA